MSWRVGSKVPINIYDGEGRPVCQCQTALYAVRIVDSVNRVADLEADREYLVKAGLANEWEDRYQSQERQIAELKEKLAALAKAGSAADSK